MDAVGVEARPVGPRRSDDRVQRVSQDGLLNHEEAASGFERDGVRVRCRGGVA